MDLMKEFQHQYLGHVNGFTKLAYKDDPAVVGVLITNENDLTFHFGLLFLPDKHNPVHQGLFERETQAFVQATGLPADRDLAHLGAGPEQVPAQRRGAQVQPHDDRRAPVRRTEGADRHHQPLGQELRSSALPALTDGDVIDVHAYGTGEALSADPRYVPNLVSSAAAAHVHGKPLIHHRMERALSRARPVHHAALHGQHRLAPGLGRSHALQLLSGRDRASGTPGGEASHQRLVDLL